MKFKNDLTADIVRSVLDYNSATGVFTWKKRPESMFVDGKQSARHNCAIWNARFAGKAAGYASSPRGYLTIRIFDSLYHAHRLAWLYVHGRWPDGDIDHINLVRGDNRMENLREAHRSQNMSNTRAHRDSLSGVKGVYFDKKSKMWVARICRFGKTTIIGAFDSLKDAGMAYEAKSKEIFGEFARAS